MKGYLYLLALALLLTSCGGNEEKDKGTKQAVQSANAAKGVKDITSFYGGECNVTSNTSKATGKRSVKLEISKSTALDSAMNITELSAANIALVFYNDLQEERQNYDEVQVSIVFGDEQRVNKSYPTQTLGMVLGKTKIVAEIIDLLQQQKYDGLDTLLDDKSGIVNYDKKLLIEKIKVADPAIGKIRSFIPYGFMFIKSDSGKDILHISGMVMRDGKNNEFSVDIDPTSADNKALFINYKL